MGILGAMPWAIEELQSQVELELDPAPMTTSEMGSLADALRPYFEDPRWRSIVIRGFEDQEIGPPQHVIQALTRWADEYDTKFELRLRLGSSGRDAGTGPRE
jgi:hypothetical protein